MNETWAYLIWMAVPAVLAPFVVKGLGPLFGLFLREGTELFTDINLERALSLRIGHLLAVTNIAIFVVTWLATVGSAWLEWPQRVSALLAATGFLAALGSTILSVRNRVGVVGHPSLLIGLITFAGGNLPIIVIIPVAFMVKCCI